MNANGDRPPRDRCGLLSRLEHRTDEGAAGLNRAVASLNAWTGRQDRLNIQTTRTALNEDQSSLTALNVHGVVDLDSLCTPLMTAAGRRSLSSP